MDLLSKKKCQACSMGSRPLNENEYASLLKHVKKWTVVNRKKLEKEFAFRNFREALKFVNKVGALAEKESHYPGVCLYGWNKVRVELYTLTLGGLSERDFILAAKVDLLKL